MKKKNKANDKKIFRQWVVMILLSFAGGSIVGYLCGM